MTTAPDQKEATLTWMPSPYVDPATPWVMPYDGGQKLVASGFWLSFGLSSTMLHLTALGFALGILPFALSVCARFATVRPVEARPAPVVVELTLADVKPPPPPPPPEMQQPPHEAAPPRWALTSKKKKRAPVTDAAEFGVIAMLSTIDEPVFVADLVGGTGGGLADVGVVGVLGKGGGKGVGGLGTGVGGGVDGGALGAVGAPLDRRDRATVAACVRRVLPQLAACIEATQRLSVDVEGGVVTGVRDNACATDVVKGVSCDVADGPHALVVKKD